MQRATRIPIAGVHPPVYYVSDTSSTLDLAASLLADTTTATPHLTTIIADRQSAAAAASGARGQPRMVRPSSPPPSFPLPTSFSH